MLEEEIVAWKANIRKLGFTDEIPEDGISESEAAFGPGVELFDD